VNSLRQAAKKKLRAWSARRHGRDVLPMRISRRRIYILPTRFGMMLAVILAAMLIAGLNYNSNLGLAFAFLVASLTLVTMHHCNRNLLGILVDVTTEIDAFAGREAGVDFVLRNESNVDRPDVEIRILSAAGMGRSSARNEDLVSVVVAAPGRGVLQVEQFAHPLPIRLVLRLDLRAKSRDDLRRPGAPGLADASLEPGKRHGRGGGDARR